MSNDAKSRVDADSFRLSSYEPVCVTMPPRQEATDVDVDAELFQYVLSAGKGDGVMSLADLDDAWAQKTFPGTASMAELRARIKEAIDKELRRNWDNLKFQRCSEALVERVCGDMDEDTIALLVEDARPLYEERIQSFGLSRAQYLHSEDMTEEDFEQKLRNDVVYQTKLNIAMDKIAAKNGERVAEEDLTEYLSCENPETYLDELRESGSVEGAIAAATRVKVMREVVRAACVTIEGK